MTIYRCGYCGNLVNNEGIPLNNWQFAMLKPFFNTAKEELVEGWCCYDAQQEGPNMVQVSREMALDAGVPEMEGTWIEW